ncbi:unnamed protein product [Ostreobium quekettii]|uniref:Uroporphyrinogen-III synthase n=1 Tax=Ostreobium quekettii TaxID=121088 RepID=A0A8S1J3T7_9CHLO|nr:unnamed protein product [Ostreobium quekettii]|eukprot:evm.model.scf_1611.1 EVM.evm.TU.scf_1611.1   scf_1611:1619-2509(-)
MLPARAGVGNPARAPQAPRAPILAPPPLPGSPPRRHALLAASPHCQTTPLVVVTRERGKNAKLISALAAKGIPHALELPLIEHADGPDRAALPEVLRARHFAWVAVTSPEAAAVFLAAWRRAGRPSVRVAAVGGGTAEAIAQAGSLDAPFVPSKATAKVLAAELPVGNNGSGSVLYPASAKAGGDLQEGLEARGFEVTRLDTYDTRPASQVDLGDLEAAVGADVVTFGSPSAVGAWVALAGEAGRAGPAFACIGRTSGEAARRAGLGRVFYPQRPGMEGWVAAVMDALDAARESVV